MLIQLFLFPPLIAQKPEARRRVALRPGPPSPFSIDVRNRNRARLIQLDRIEVHILRGRRPHPLLSQISQEPQFSAVAGLARRDKIQPAVIVVIEARKFPQPRHQLKSGKRHTLQPLCPSTFPPTG